MDEREKDIDQAWKEAVEKEKELLKKGEGSSSLEPDFSLFITTLGMQAAIFLGQIPNPNTNKKEENLNQAKFIIDTLGLLRDKTKGNLSPDESKLLENLLYELRMQYIQKTGK